MKKSNFNIPDGKLEVFLETCESIIKQEGKCCGVDCDNCPLEVSVAINGNDCTDTDINSEDVENAKQFIKLFGGSMTEQKLYQEMQKMWVEFHSVKVGDVVRVNVLPEYNQLGCDCSKDEHIKKDYLNKNVAIGLILRNYIRIDGWHFPFFCLEYIGKAEKKVEITITMNGEKVDPKEISDGNLAHKKGNILQLIIDTKEILEKTINSKK